MMERSLARTLKVPTKDKSAPRKQRRTRGPTAAEMHERLSSAIADYRLRPGQKLAEEELAGIFGTSRAKVREVLLKLGMDGLVTIQPNRGSFVAKPSVNETKQILEARRVVEAATVKNAAKRGDKENFDRLRKLAQREREAWAAHELFEAVRASREFHLAIANIAGNEILTDTLRRVLSQTSLALGLYASRGSPGCLCDDHFELLDALEAGNVELAGTLMLRHLDQIERGMNLADANEDVDLRQVLTSAIY